MLRSYEAARFRLTDRHATVKTSIGVHRYNAANDADAISTAKALHAPSYDPGAEMISVWEIREGEEDRHVAIIEGRL